MKHAVGTDGERIAHSEHMYAHYRPSPGGSSIDAILDRLADAVNPLNEAHEALGRLELHGRDLEPDRLREAWRRRHAMQQMIAGLLAELRAAQSHVARQQR